MSVRTNERERPAGAGLTASPRFRTLGPGRGPRWLRGGGSPRGRQVPPDASIGGMQRWHSHSLRAGIGKCLALSQVASHPPRCPTISPLNVTAALILSTVSPVGPTSIETIRSGSNLVMGEAPAFLWWGRKHRSGFAMRQSSMRSSSCLCPVQSSAPCS